MPWYRHMDNNIDSGKEYYAILGQWEITEYLEESDYCYVENIDSEAPVFCATIHPNVLKRDIDIIVDKNGKAAICIEGRFFRLERSVEEELRTWE